MLQVNPMLEEEDLAKAYAKTIGIVKNKEYVQN